MTIYVLPNIYNRITEIRGTMLISIVNTIRRCEKTYGGNINKKEATVVILITS